MALQAKAGGRLAAFPQAGYDRCLSYVSLGYHANSRMEGDDNSGKNDISGTTFIIPPPRISKVVPPPKNDAVVLSLTGAFLAVLRLSRGREPVCRRRAAAAQLRHGDDRLVSPTRL